MRELLNKFLGASYQQWNNPIELSRITDQALKEIKKKIGGMKKDMTIIPWSEQEEHDRAAGYNKAISDIASMFK